MKRENVRKAYDLERDLSNLEVKLDKLDQARYTIRVFLFSGNDKSDEIQLDMSARESIKAHGTAYLKREISKLTAELEAL